MKKYEKKTVTEMIYALTEITCNKCGHTEKVVENGFTHNLFQEVDFSFGYGSKFDMEDWEFHLCDNCAEELVKSLKYVPKGMESFEGYGVQMSQEEFEEWK